MTTQLLLMGCKPVNNSSVAKIGLVAFLIFAYQGGAAGDKTIDGGAGTNTLNVTASSKH